jgi:hypothetical protein
MSTTKKPPKHFWDHMHYVALSRCTSLQGLHIVTLHEELIRSSPKVKEYMASQKKHLNLCYIPAYSQPAAFKIVYNNVGSLQRKWLPIATNKHIIAADVIFLAETWLSAAHRNEDFTLPHFCQSRQDSTVVKGHRGMLAFVKTDMTPSFSTIQEAAQMEMCRFDFEYNTSKIQIIALYKPPSTQLSAFKFHLARVLAPVNLQLPIILIGDFNINIFDPSSQPFCEYMQSTYGLRQIVTEATTAEATCIDLVFTNIASASAFPLTNNWSSHHYITVYVTP